MIQAPVVVKTEYVCIDLTPDGTLQLLTPGGEMKEDISLPTANHLSHLEKELRAVLDGGKKEALVVVQKWGDLEQMIVVREGNDIWRKVKLKFDFDRAQCNVRVKKATPSSAPQVVRVREL